MNPPLPIPHESLVGPTRLILDNHRRWLGRDLVELLEGDDPVQKLFSAPCVVLSALGRPGTDHRFNYANQAGLAAFETSWEEFVGRPSSQSAEPVHRDERRRLLDEVGQRGFIENYSGVRISRQGRRFRILRATVFNLLDERDEYAGQAATFTEREDL